MSEATRLDNIKCVDGAVFGGLIKALMTCEVFRNCEMPDSFIEDARLSKEDAVKAVVDLLSWKQICEISEISRVRGERVNTVGDVYDLLLNIMCDAVVNGDYKDLIAAAYACVEKALTYDWFEDWGIIIEHAVSDGNFSEDIFLKVVKYLRNEYADESQSLATDVAS
jgi:hypothetical protein